MRDDLETARALCDEIRSSNYRTLALNERLSSENVFLRAMLQRTRDFLKFTANSDRGIVAEIDAVIERKL